MSRRLHLTLVLLVLSMTTALYAQNLLLSRRIRATDTITDEGLTFAASSDDAEQENDAIDALFDDDLDWTRPCGWRVKVDLR